MAPEETANKFNEFINARDISGLSSMMTNDHSFIDTLDNTITGKENCVNVWAGFFKAFPDYKNHFTKVTAKFDVVMIEGFSTCSEKMLDGPALWTAKIEGDKISEWRVYEDSEMNRSRIYL